MGDDKYGDFDLNKRLHAWAQAHVLHAWRLQFSHPATAERITLNAPLPAELAEFIPPA